MFISVAVPTCDRPFDIDRCLASLAEVDYPAWRVIVIDQSDGDETRRVVESWRTQIPQVTYVWLGQKNASAARNLAIERASGAVLAFIDDDCTVGSDWLDRVRDAFELEPQASLIFGLVGAATHDASQAFVPTYEFQREARLRGSLGALRVRAMGASMYLSLECANRFSFDLLLGPGAHFRSSQDWDYAYRVLSSGGLVFETPLIGVTHHGARSYAAGAATAKLRDYLYGIGAAHAKLLRCGDWIMVAVIIDKLARSIAVLKPHRALFHRPTQFGRLLMYLRGLRDGFRAPVDRLSGVFRVGPETANQT